VRGEKEIAMENYRQMKIVKAKEGTISEFYSI
jgi:hypothetical protein